MLLGPTPSLPLVYVKSVMMGALLALSAAKTFPLAWLMLHIRRKLIPPAPPVAAAPPLSPPVSPPAPAAPPVPVSPPEPAPIPLPPLPLLAPPLPLVADPPLPPGVAPPLALVFPPDPTVVPPPVPVTSLALVLHADSATDAHHNRDANPIRSSARWFDFDDMQSPLMNRTPRSPKPASAKQTTPPARSYHHDRRSPQLPASDARSHPEPRDRPAGVSVRCFRVYWGNMRPHELDALVK
jgi:hypothetical protein